MKKILLSLGTIVFVGSIAAASTGAFFNDTETSTGNTFAAGAIDLKVDSDSHYAGLVCVDTDGYHWALEDQEGTTTRPDLLGQPCDGAWTETDLGPTNTFFNFSDLKPGDSGENTISLHVLNNDAYACANVTNLQDDDNGITEPEGDDGDTTDGAGNGELSSQLHFFAWADDGDNIWEAGELPLFSNTEGPASDVLGGKSYSLFTPQTQAMSAGSTQYLGLYWCYGAVTVDTVNHTLSCDGSAVNNLTQTDSTKADISFYVEQARNNPNFTCTLPEGPAPVLPPA
jgi:predicted ribosomally synthesized peptide with SipW-like signal peptide